MADLFCEHRLKGKVLLLGYMKTWYSRLDDINDTDSVVVKGDILKIKHELKTKQQIMDYAREAVRKGMTQDGLMR